MIAVYDELGGFWFVQGEDGGMEAYPFETEQDAWDWIEAWHDD